MISVLIPWRSDDPDRIRAWDYNRPRWEQLDVQLCVSDDGRDQGPFSVARAVNLARAHASGNILAVFGADHIPPGPSRLAWIRERLEQHPWTGVYAGTRVFSREGTERVLAGRPPAVGAYQSHFIGMCQGVIAVRADVWDDVGGMDNHFEGWGAEDVALRVALGALYPAGTPGGVGDAWTLWHPDRHGTAELTAANVARCTEYERAAAEGRMREFLEEVRAGDGPRDAH